MTLKTYAKKRDFKKTTEPSVKKKSSASSHHHFVIQKHDARHLHYDLRLEMNGVLKSWAVPKGPSLDPTIKRLAVHVEDHPLAYANFEGTIPKGEYGAGTVIVWDQGQWESKEDEDTSYKQGKLSFILKGEKLKGAWALIQLKNSNKNWLLIKEQDRYAKPYPAYDILTAQPNSVLKQTQKKKNNSIIFTAYSKNS